MSRILLVTIELRGRTGTEVVCYETAHGLRKRNHDVAIYTRDAGPLAEKLRADGFQVFTDLAALSSVPEVVQANQSDPLLDAVARFPGVPVIAICHDTISWFSEPVDLPSIRRHVAVDVVCRERIANRIPRVAEQIDLLHNAVDLDRFALRSALPERPKRALIIAKQSNYLDAVRAACLRHGIDVEVVGPAVGNEIDNLSSRLADYDLVFATARSALEAMAAGCAVILVADRGLGGLVTRDTAPSWRDKNFGIWLLSRPISENAIAAEIDRYDPSDARMVSDYIREHSSLDRYLDRLEEMHRDVIADGAGTAVDYDVLLNRINQAFRLLAAVERVQRQAEFQRRAEAREVEFKAAFQSYRESYRASRKLGRRIRRKIRILLTRI